MKQKMQNSKKSTKPCTLSTGFIALIMLIICNKQAYTNNAIEQDTQQSNIRNVMIGGVELNIPKSFISGALPLNGIAKYSLTLTFAYPEIKGGIGNGHDFILVTLKDFKHDLSRMTKITHEKYLIDKYWCTYLEVDREVDIYKIKYKGFNHPLQQRHYKIKNFGHELDVESIIENLKQSQQFTKEKEDLHRRTMMRQNEKFQKRLKGQIDPCFKHVYTNDDPEKPEEFTVCESRLHTDNPSCESAFFYNDLFIELHFNRRFIENFDDIKAKTLGLIKQWQTIKDETRNTK